VKSSDLAEKVEKGTRGQVKKTRNPTEYLEREKGGKLLRAGLLPKVNPRIGSSLLFLEEESHSTKH